MHLVSQCECRPAAGDRAWGLQQQEVSRRRWEGHLCLLPWSSIWPRTHLTKPRHATVFYHHQSDSATQHLENNLITPGRSLAAFSRFPTVGPTIGWSARYFLAPEAWTVWPVAQSRPHPGQPCILQLLRAVMWRASFLAWKMSPKNYYC